MNTRDFYLLVDKMRQAQVGYFSTRNAKTADGRTRNEEYKKSALHYEGEVDKEVRRYKFLNNIDQPKDLFSNA